jgi:hypothetical protein
MEGNPAMTTATLNAAGQGNGTPADRILTEEERSKDTFFVQIAEVVEAMIARHGKDFATGTLLLSARFVAEGRPLINRDPGKPDRKN